MSVAFILWIHPEAVTVNSHPPWKPFHVQKEPSEALPPTPALACAQRASEALLWLLRLCSTDSREEFRFTCFLHCPFKSSE